MFLTESDRSTPSVKKKNPVEKKNHVEKKNSLAARLWTRLGGGLLVGVLAASLFVLPASAQDVGGYYYPVQHGDSWTSVAHKVGLTVTQLQAVNPHHIHSHHWLITGHHLFIPVNYQGIESSGTHTVQPGESWERIAAQYGVPVRLLWTANFKLLRPHLVLRPGDLLQIPASASSAPADEVPIGDGADQPAVTPQRYLADLLMAENGLQVDMGPQIRVRGTTLGETEVNIAYTTGILGEAPEGSTLTNHFIALYAGSETGFELIQRIDLDEALSSVETVAFGEGETETALITGNFLRGGVFYLFDIDATSITQTYEGAGGRTINTVLLPAGGGTYGVLARYAPGGPIPQGLFTDALIVAAVDGTYQEVFSESFSEGALISGVEPAAELADDDLPTVSYHFVAGDGDLDDLERVVTSAAGEEQITRYVFDGSEYVPAE